MPDTPIRLPLDYVEFTSPLLEETQAFFSAAFGWDHIDYGEDYRDIQGAGIGGGIARGPLRDPLPVLKARKRLQSLAAGNVLRVEATDPASAIDFPHFCAESGHVLEDQSEADGIYVFEIRKTA